MKRKLKTFARRFGIDAPQLSVRPHMPWYWRWMGMVAIVAGMAILAPWIAPSDPNKLAMRFKFRPPSGDFLFGTDTALIRFARRCTNAIGSVDAQRNAHHECIWNPGFE